MDSDYRAVLVDVTMKPQTKVLGILAFVLAFPDPATAQVEKVAIRTTGISCGACAAIFEIHFKRMPGVENVAISLSTETITLFYKSGASLDTRQIRRVLQQLEVGIVQFQITAMGRVQEESANLFFVAAKDKFALDNSGASDIPRDRTVRLQGVIDDRFNPVRIKISNFQPLQK
jgi:copper chaperone CopZ